MGISLKNSNYAACTIVSKNYFAYARTLYASFILHNPDAKFFVLLVDENNDDIALSQEPFEVIEAFSLNIPGFKQAAFKFDIMELNTNVKPSFLKYLLHDRGVAKLIYLDPDILLYNELSEVYSQLSTFNIVITPHCISPINDNYRPAEQDFLLSGVYNLGFIGISNSQESYRFLDWWEQRCLKLGFAEPRMGLFVDQKWINFAPCFFEGVSILKHPGYNMAYWNLHERAIENKNGQWIVNGEYPLVFYHFSGIACDDQQQISRHQDRFDLTNRPDLIDIFKEYRALLKNHGIDKFRQYAYAYATFSNSEYITHIARRLYSVNESSFHGLDPFTVDGEVYQWCKKEGFFGTIDQSGKFNSRTYSSDDLRIRTIHFVLRMLFKILGSNKYTMLMKYLSYIAVLRNQKLVFNIK
jgi:hypothetical protein